MAIMEKKESSQMWTSKHLPKKIKEVEGQEAPAEQVRKFIADFKRQKHKALLVYGEPGCGKTSAVYAIAHELGLEVFELNASDFRNTEAIKSVLGSASKQMSLFYKGKVLLVDELDGISGTEDRGGITALTNLIKDTSFPLVMVANDPFDQKFSPLRKAATLVQFNSLGFNSVLNVLKRIAEKEAMQYDEDALKSLARRAGTDLRAGINDFQNLTMGKKKLAKEDLEALSDRERTEVITDALLKVFKTTDPKLSISAFDRVNEGLEKCMLWIDENLPAEYDKPADLCRAYHYLSRADIMNRRIMRWQHWRFLVYVNAFITAGISVSKDEKYKKMVQYKQTSRLLKIYIANMKYNKRKNIAAKIARKLHSSEKEVIKDTVPYLQAMMKDKKMASELIDYFELDDDEVTWLKR